MTPRKKALVSSVLAALLLGGCTVGPDFVKPADNAPANWHDALAASEASDHVTTSADPEPAWWVRFNDPELTSLIDRSTAGNLDVQIAVVRIAQARANERATASAGIPSVDMDASYIREKIGQGLGTGMTSAPSGGNPVLSSLVDSLAKPSTVYQGALDASWELDLFGRVRRSVEGARAATDVAIGNRDDALVTLQAEVAQTYAQLRAAQTGREIARQDIEVQTQILELTRERSARGLVSDLDVENATAAVGTTEASLAQYDQQIASNLNALAVLIGKGPGALDAELSQPMPIPTPAHSIPIGLPATLARRRPDIRAAEARLHQQTASVGVAVAQFYPDISLTGEVGRLGASPSDLGKWSNNFFSFGPAISLPVFEGGELRANLTLAKADQAEAALAYRKTILDALQDVENAIASYRIELQRHQALEKTVAAQTTALAIARNQYVHGVSTFIDVLTVENGLAQQHEQLVQSTLSLTTDTVNLYKALGGGWQWRNEQS